MRKGINETLGLPDDYSINIKDAITVIDRFKESMFGEDKPISKISFIYYHDKFGNFMKPKKHIDSIVNSMFENLDSETRFELLTYFSAED